MITTQFLLRGHSRFSVHVCALAKQARTLEVLCSPSYAQCDVLFLQEVAFFLSSLPSYVLNLTPCFLLL